MDIFPKIGEKRKNEDTGHTQKETAKKFYTLNKQFMTYLQYCYDANKNSDFSPIVSDYLNYSKEIRENVHPPISGQKNYDSFNLHSENVRKNSIVSDNSRFDINNPMVTAPPQSIEIISKAPSLFDNFNSKSNNAFPSSKDFSFNNKPDEIKPNFPPNNFIKESQSLTIQSTHAQSTNFNVFSPSLPFPQNNNFAQISTVPQNSPFPLFNSNLPKISTPPQNINLPPNNTYFPSISTLPQNFSLVQSNPNFTQNSNFSAKSSFQPIFGSNTSAPSDIPPVTTQPFAFLQQFSNQTTNSINSIFPPSTQTPSIFGVSSGLNFPNILGSTQFGSDPNGPQKPAVFGQMGSIFQNFPGNQPLGTNLFTDSLKKEGSDGDDEDEPIPETTEMGYEKNALCSVRAKLYFKNKDKFCDIGVGIFNIKAIENDSNHFQLIFRIESSRAGNLLMNIKVEKNSNVLKVQNDSNLLITSVPNPPIHEIVTDVPKDSFKTVTYLIKTKTSSDMKIILGFLKDS